MSASQSNFKPLLNADIDSGTDEINTDDLQFQDIRHTSSRSSVQTKPGVGEGERSGSGRPQEQTVTFTNFPEPAESDEESSSKADLRGKTAPGFWTFEYYQQFFNVETHQVLRRILGSALPNPRSNFLTHHIRPNPDLYGPFWVCTTLVFTTAIAGNVANYFQSQKRDDWTYDFHKVTFAATAIFAYWWLMPTLLCGLLWWRGNAAGVTFLELLCVYGYSLTIYVPISILWVIQLSWLQWLLVMLGMALSGSVLLMTLWPALKEDNKKVGLIAMACIILVHGLLAVGFVLYFFHVPSKSDVMPISGNSTSTTETILNRSTFTTRLPLNTINSNTSS